MGLRIEGGQSRGARAPLSPRAKVTYRVHGMRKLSALFALVLFHGALAGDGAACDRAASPLDDPAVAVAVADVVAAVDVIAVGGGSASVVVQGLLKGPVARGDKLEIDGVKSRSEGRDCGASTVEVGKSYLVMLFRPVPGAAKYDLVEPASSVVPNETASWTAMEAAVAKHHPTSAWHTGASGVQTRLVLDPHSEKGEVDLFVLARNTGKTAIDFTRKYWPEAEQTKCSLSIADAAKKPVDARDVPIPKQDIAAYFAKHPGLYTVKVNPGASHLLRLPRITTAASGWGYKEELGFKFYPVRQHGPHTVAADCANVLGPGSRMTTAELNATL
ncbi:Hypothetical protein A7982_03545 [Minicystis rosea]|nr:Hypothetical protein A7982_03545 [Minicystis rosea]